MKLPLIRMLAPWGVVELRDIWPAYVLSPQSPYCLELIEEVRAQVLAAEGIGLGLSALAQGPDDWLPYAEVW